MHVLVVTGGGDVQHLGVAVLVVREDEAGLPTLERGCQVV